VEARDLSDDQSTDPVRAQSRARIGAIPERPALESRHVRLRPVSPADIGPLYELALDPDVLWRWRSRGTTPSPESFAQNLWSETLVQFVVCTPDSARPLGLVTAYHADLRNRWAYIAAVMAPSTWRQGWPLEASMLLIDYLFRIFDLRKLYLESLEFNASQYSSAVGSFLVEESRLVAHEYYSGRWWDLITYALYRDVWEPLDLITHIGGS
jgi:RimJ/RimL family protein N-acetyltransferase